MGQSVSDFIEIHKYLRKCRIHYSYTCKATKRYCVGNIPRYLNFVRKFLHSAGKVPTNLENIATHFIFVRNVPAHAINVGKFLQIQKQKFLQILKLTKTLTAHFDYVGN